MKYVLDASAAIAFLRQEPGADVVRMLLIDSANEIHIHAVNLLETHYRITSFGGDIAADEAVVDLKRIGVKVSETIPDPLCSRASFFKSRYPFPSLGDSICIALGED